MIACYRFYFIFFVVVVVQQQRQWWRQQAISLFGISLFGLNGLLFFCSLLLLLVVACNFFSSFSTISKHVYVRTAQLIIYTKFLMLQYISSIINKWILQYTYAPTYHIIHATSFLLLFLLSSSIFNFSEYINFFCVELHGLCKCVCLLSPKTYSE